MAGNLPLEMPRDVQTFRRVFGPGAKGKYCLMTFGMGMGLFNVTSTLVKASAYALLKLKGWNGTVVFSSDDGAEQFTVTFYLAYEKVEEMMLMVDTVMSLMRMYRGEAKCLGGFTPFAEFTSEMVYRTDLDSPHFCGTAPRDSGKQLPQGKGPYKDIQALRGSCLSSFQEGRIGHDGTVCAFILGVHLNQRFYQTYQEERKFSHTPGSILYDMNMSHGFDGLTLPFELGRRSRSTLTNDGFARTRI